MSGILVHICLLASFAVFCSGLVDWDEIDSRYTIIKDEVRKVIMYSKLVAWIDDREIALENFEKLDHQYFNAVGISQEAENLISSKKLTSEKAKDMFQKFQLVVNQYYTSTGWTESVILRIRNVIISSVTYVKRLYKEIIELLEGVHTVDTDWDDIERKILTIEGKLQYVLNFINAVAWLESETLSSNWNMDVVEGCKSLLNEAYALSGNKSLTVETVKQVENHISNSLLAAKTKLNSEMLSPSAKNEILEVLSDATSQILGKFQEIMELVSDKLTQTADYDKVLRFFTRIQEELFNLVPKVGVAALEDNNKEDFIHERISQYLQLELLKPVEIITEIKSDVLFKSLTAGDAYEIILEVLSELLNIDRGVRDLMGNKVNSHAKMKVKDIMAETYDLISNIQLNIYELLNKDDNDEPSYQEILYDFLNKSQV